MRPVPPPSDNRRRDTGTATWLGIAALLGLTISAYALRFLSGWAVLSWAEDRRFDPHGFGLLGDGLVLLAMLPAVGALTLWALWQRRKRPWRGVWAPAKTPARTAWSVVLLVLVGAPLPGQVWALLLPVSDAWPALVSAALWLATAVVLRAAAVSPPPARSG